MFWVKLQGPSEQANHLVEVFPREGLEQRQPPQVAVVSAEIFCRLAPCPLDLGLLDAGGQLGDDLLGHHVLQGENVLERPVEPIGPQVVAGFTVDELARDTHPVGRLPYAAFQHIAHAEFAADLPDVERLALVGKA